MNSKKLQKIGRILKIAALGAISPVLGIGGPSSRFPTRTIERDTFSFDASTGLLTDRVKRSQEPYKLVIDGMVEEPVSLTYQDLRALPQTSQTNDFHCVEGWTIPEVVWGGIMLSEIFKLIKPKDVAQYAIFHSLGETGSAPQGQSWYIESVKISDLLDPRQEFLLALDLDGKPLSHDRGAPARLVTPFLLAYKSIKFVTRIELSSKLQEGWWTLANPIYDWQAKVSPGRLKRR